MNPSRCRQASMTNLLGHMFTIHMNGTFDYKRRPQTAKLGRPFESPFLDMYLWM